MLKENDIRPAELMKLKEPLLEADKEFLRSRKNQFVSVVCPACGLNKKEFWSNKEGFSYDICANCKTIYKNPRASQKLLDEFYFQSKNYEFWNKYIFPATNEERKKKIYEPRTQKIITICNNLQTKHDSILEIGAGFGTFCETLKESNFFERVIALEPTPSLAETCKAKGFETYAQTIETLSIEKESIDIISCFEVIEHLFDPGIMVEKAKDFLKKGGLFIGSCPNGESLGTILLKEQFRSIDHEHINMFNPKSIYDLFMRHGFELIEVSTPGLLDVDIIVNQLSESNTKVEDKFINYLFYEMDANARSKFQNYLIETGLSSHLWFCFRKIK